MHYKAIIESNLTVQGRIDIKNKKKSKEIK